MNKQINILSLLLLFSLNSLFCYSKYAAAFYPPRRDPHPDTKYPWVCKTIKNYLTNPELTCPFPGIYIAFTHHMEYYSFKYPYSGIMMSVLYIGESTELVFPETIVCFMRFPDSRNPATQEVEAILLSKFATLLNKFMSFDPKFHTLEYGPNGLPIDILATFYNMKINPVNDPQPIEGYNRFPTISPISHLQVKDTSLSNANNQSKLLNNTFSEGIPYAGGYVLDGDYSNFITQKFEKDKCENKSEEENGHNNNNKPRQIKLKLSSSNYLNQVNGRLQDQASSLFQNPNTAVSRAVTEKPVKKPTTPAQLPKEPSKWSKIKGAVAGAAVAAVAAVGGAAVAVGEWVANGIAVAQGVKELTDAAKEMRVAEQAIANANQVGQVAANANQVRQVATNTNQIEHVNQAVQQNEIAANSRPIESHTDFFENPKPDSNSVTGGSPGGGTINGGTGSGTVTSGGGGTSRLTGIAKPAGPRQV
ncbi:hypothetical protein ACTFIR_002253 [Dictyostelium discoideum]